jgi:hypothetical protein
MITMYFISELYQEKMFYFVVRYDISKSVYTNSLVVMKYMIYQFVITDILFSVHFQLY